MSVEVGVVGIHCAVCDEVIDITVLADIVSEGDGTQRLVFTEENWADLWAHMWTHESEG